MGTSTLAAAAGADDDESMTGPAISTKRLTKRYGSTTVVDELSLTVPRGIIFGFLGPNGAGKTTTIDLLLGLREPTAGSARVLGVDVVADPDLVRNQVGAVLDEPGLYEHLSALDNLHFWARVWSVPEERIEFLLRGIGLWDRRLDRVGSWSRGMQQQLALIRARLHDPELLFLDEPTAGLDVLSARDVRAQLRVLTEAGKSVFLTTHNMTEAEELCDRVAVIQRGRLVAEGTPAELMNRSGHELHIVGSGLDHAAKVLKRHPEILAHMMDGDRLWLRLADPDPSGLVADLVAAGVSIREVANESRLEDAFVELTGADHGD